MTIFVLSFAILFLHRPLDKTLKFDQKSSRLMSKSVLAIAEIHFRFSIFIGPYGYYIHQSLTLLSHCLYKNL